MSDQTEDSVNHPKHYTAHPSGVECIQITEHMGFCLGNAVKYIWRADLKNDAVEDLKKARWYIDREIRRRGGRGRETPSAEANLCSIEGELIRAGTMRVGGEEATGVFISMTIGELRAIKRLPMYRRVAVTEVEA